MLTTGDGAILRFQAAFGAAPFIPGGNVGAINDPQAHAVADLDGDGNLDLAVPDTLGDRVVVLLGDGAGGFTTNPGLAFSTLPHDRPRTIASGDFNEDGIADLVIGTVGTRLDTTHRVTVRFGVGDGSFTGLVVLNVSSTRIQSVAVADFDADGNQDIAAVAAARIGFGGFGGVFYGDGLGGFTAQVELKNNGSNMPTPAISLVATDLDGDTLPDVAVVISQGDPEALNDKVFVGTSNGAASPGASATTPASSAG